jgi:hypothetical protein
LETLELPRANEVDGTAKETKEGPPDGHPFLPWSMRRRLLNIISKLLVYNFARTYDGVTKKSSCFNIKTMIAVTTAVSAGDL